MIILFFYSTNVRNAKIWPSDMSIPLKPIMILNNIPSRDGFKEVQGGVHPLAFARRNANLTISNANVEFVWASLK